MTECCRCGREGATRSPLVLGLSVAICDGCSSAFNAEVDHV